MRGSITSSAREDEINVNSSVNESSRAGSNGERLCLGACCWIMVAAGSFKEIRVCILLFTSSLSVARYSLDRLPELLVQAAIYCNGQLCIKYIIIIFTWLAVHRFGCSQRWNPLEAGVISVRCQDDREISKKIREPGYFQWGIEYTVR